MPTPQEKPTTSPIGRDTVRVDGPEKVSGRAQYTADFHFPGMLYGVPVEAKIRKRQDREARHRRSREDARRARDPSPREHREDVSLYTPGLVSPESVRSAAHRSRTMRSAITASTSPSLWPTPSRPPKQQPMRCARRTPKKNRTSRLTL